jgi:cytochrome c nitrite reductase small subunit
MKSEQTSEKRIKGWLPVLLCIAFGILIGVEGFTFRYAEGLSYLRNDPKVCVNCHVMQEHYDSWLRTSHRSVATCNDCHVPNDFPENYLVKTLNGWNHSKAFTLQDFPRPIRIRQLNLNVLQHNCIECHKIAVSEISAHADVQKGTARCTDCHRSVGHMATY